MAHIHRRKQHLIDRFETFLDEPVSSLEDQYRLLDSLGMHLNTAVLFSEEQPTAALEVIWHFLDRLPAAFGKVADKDAMADMCTFLAEDLLRVAVRERTHLAETVQRLRSAQAAHRHADDPFYAVPEVLANPRLPLWAKAVIEPRDVVAS